eukprot:4672905-Amphidinium_carterae.1
MALVDSKAAFEERARQMAIPDPVIETMASKGWTTFATYGFSSTYQPGQSDDSAFVKTVLEPVLGQDLLVHAPKLRRLLFEAYTACAAEMKGRMGKGKTEEPVSMPMSERNARTQKLRRRLPGLPMELHYEPSHQLVNSMAYMVDAEATIRYAEWEKCTSREEEIRGERRSKDSKPDDRKEYRTNLTSDLRVYLALHRRGVAAELGILMSYEDHDILVQLLMTELLREPLYGHHAVSHDQLRRADAEAWKVASSLITAGLQPDPQGRLPAGLAMRRAAEDGRVLRLLSPLPMSAPAKRSTSPPPGGSQKKPRAKAKTPQRGAMLPDGLHGSSTTPDGTAICFAYNQKKCVQQNSRGCGRGRHVCTKCFKVHPYADCPEKHCAEYQGKRVVSELTGGLGVQAVVSVLADGLGAQRVVGVLGDDLGVQRDEGMCAEDMDMKR